MAKRIAWALAGIVATWGGFAPAQGDVGFLSVTSTPAAHVIVDDVDTKAMTPLEHHALPAGKHKLTLLTDAGTKRTLGVVITAGQDKRVNVTM